MALWGAILILAFLFLKDLGKRAKWSAGNAAAERIYNKYKFDSYKQMKFDTDEHWSEERQEIYKKYKEKYSCLVARDIYVAKKLRDEGYDFNPSYVTMRYHYRAQVRDHTPLMREYQELGLIPKDDQDAHDIFHWSDEILCDKLFKKS